MAVPSPSPRRINTPSWFDLRLVLGVVLVLVAVLLGATLFSRASDTHPVLTVTRDLAAGTVLQPEDLATTQVQLPDDGAGIYLTDVADAEGRSLGHALAKGELVPLAAVTRSGSRTTVTVPLAAGTAPDLHVGERIEIWLSTSSCASVVLLDDVTVQDVRADSTGSFDSGSGAQDVVISVAPRLAGRVIAAQAITDAQIRAGVLSGGSSTPTPGASSLPAARDGGLPADLAACASPSSGP